MEPDSQFIPVLRHKQMSGCRQNNSHVVVDWARLQQFHKTTFAHL
jgi:hypothetical protein